ncbi:hypothetical protein A3J61_00495 [Candidatus Nomurabacteria bacterium RIFCSPHIGHO2_02_FULL_38_15]|uniref:DUF541 domain-containing protein n=1 Tax=Candidatus Nomurabacteria bacterium RIFCSPHIGHO2_02_FULL_38_15 TaxID=1801752 RepID=A0A1F6VQR6_9BACT|nr:MAG: hypothetical protein A3J61_00495 [Candidatus Nomurabacteria bacterium RIFCSPHIGHO2_02_FULL_38_15]
MIIDDLQKERLMKNGKIFAVIIGIYFITLIITQVKGWQIMRSDNTPVPTISVNGVGEVYAVPDVAQLRVSVVGDAKDRAGSVAKQAEVKQKFLTVMGDFKISDKDYKTEYISTNPKYEWQRQTIYCVTVPCPQPDGKNVLTGFTTDESLIVKVRNIDDAGKIYEALVTAGAQNVSGPDMMIDDEEKFVAEAREKAILDAKIKAKKLARDLGVRIVRISSFNENGGGYPMPMYASDTAMLKSTNAVPETVISKGENLITSNVTITYEIR